MTAFPRVVLMAGLALLLSMDGNAHNPLDDPEWCEGSNHRLTIVDEISWSAEDLIPKERNSSRKGEDDCPLNQDNSRTCGQFDDDWLGANRMAVNYCSRYEVRFAGSRDPDHGTVVFIPSGPAIFLDEESHHARYSIQMGLSGHCVRCEPLAVEQPDR